MVDRQKNASSSALSINHQLSSINSLPFPMWRQLTETDLRSAITSAEDAGIRQGLLAGDQEDPFVTTRRQVVAAFRGAIRSGPGNRLDPDEETLPDVAIYHAVAKIRFRLLTRFASELLDDDRRTENKEAEAWLREVRRGIEKIEAPDEAPGVTVIQTITLLSTNERQATRENLRGL